jgi:hypothetical protein
MSKRLLRTAATLVVAVLAALGVRFTAEAAPVTFAHPGVLVGRAQLDFVKPAWPLASSPGWPRTTR